LDGPLKDNKCNLQIVPQRSCEYPSTKHTAEDNVTAGFWTILAKAQST